MEHKTLWWNVLLIQFDCISHDPEELLQQYQAQQQDIQSLRDQLKRILAAALERDA